MPTATVSTQLKQREAKQRFKKGDKVVVAVEVTKVLDDGSVVRLSRLDRFEGG